MVWICAFTGLLAACSRESTLHLEEPVKPQATQEVQVLNFYNWDTYIDPAILENFEEEYGVKVNYEIFSGNDELYDRVSADPSAYDLIVPTDYLVTVLRRENLLAPLNKDNLPNFENIDQIFINPVMDPGNRFCVPYLWGTIALGYNLRATGKEITGWKDVFGAANVRRVALLDGARETLGLTLLALGFSPNSTSITEIAAARDFLLDHAGQIVAIAPDTGQDLLVEGKADIVLEYSGDIFQVMDDHPDIRYAIPEEGALLFSDNMCIPVASRNKELAEQFINYILEPEVGAALSNYTRYSTPNQAALPFVNQADRDNPSLYPPAEIRNQLFYQVDVGSEATLLYEEAWEEVKSAIMR
jgi:spermidine/putrescine transport system substrate-binding protein